LPVTLAVAVDQVVMFGDDIRADVEGPNGPG
jgi:hypothetical protein